MALIRSVVSGFVASLIVFAQLPQCGGQLNTESLPRSLSVIAHPDQAETEISNGDGSSVRLFAGIEQVCSLADARYLIFGNPGHGTAISILRISPLTIEDSFLAFEPVLSPDRRWIAFAKFFPRQAELPLSSEYLLYDLSKSADNRPAGVLREGPLDTDVGQPVYPAGWKNEPLDNIDAPPEQRHFKMSPIYWLPDSRAFLFADGVTDQHSLVLVDIDSRGSISAAVTDMPKLIRCANEGSASGSVNISSVEFGARQGSDRILFVRFESGSCVSRPQLLHSADFRPARRETRIIKPPLKRAKRSE